MRARDVVGLKLPNGETVLVRRRDREAIISDYTATGSVFLDRDPGTEVYHRVDPSSIEAAARSKHARRIG